MTRADALIEASDSDETLLLEMIQYKGARGRRNLLVVEGHDDVTFLDAILSRLNPLARQSSATYNSKGKGNVLSLFDLVHESLELDSEEYWFFIDADFDGLRGREPNERLWMTPTYSFENLLVSAEVLEALLAGEYRCNDAIGAAEIEIISTQFQEFIDSYMRELRFANLCAYYCLKTGTKNHNHDEIITESIGIIYPEIFVSLTYNDILEKMPKQSALDRAVVETYLTDFSALDPISQWRGKFLYAGFLLFLEELKKDRGSKTPKYFKRRQSMTFNPRTDAVRALTSIAVLPNDLVAYVGAIPGP